MDKKGILLAEEVVKMIIAIIGIGLLAFLLFSLYNINKTSNDLELAESSLEHLVSELRAERDEIEIFNPKGWWIVSDEIFGEDSLCICEKIGECEKAGACFESEFQVENEIQVNLKSSTVTRIENRIEIDEPPIVLQINYGDKSISV